MANTNAYSAFDKQFKEACKVINLTYEYPGYAGEKKWAIITNYTEAELRINFGDCIAEFEPFVVLTIEQGKTITKFESNERKHRKRQAELGDAFDFESGITEIHHRELIKFSELNVMNRITLRDAVMQLKPIQRRRFIKKYIYGFSSREIAEQEGVNYSKVDKSIAAAIKNLKNILE